MAANQSALDAIAPHTSEPGGANPAKVSVSENNTADGFTLAEMPTKESDPTRAVMLAIRHDLDTYDILDGRKVLAVLEALSGVSTEPPAVITEEAA